MAFALQIVYLQVKIFYLLHLSRVVQFQCKFSTTDFWAQRFLCTVFQSQSGMKAQCLFDFKTQLWQSYFVENVVCHCKMGLHYKALLVHVLNLHNSGEIEEVVNLIFKCKNLLQDFLTTTKLSNNSEMHTYCV